MDQGRAASSGLAISETADRELKATRLFDAPREIVFNMWTDPEHVARWWGPNGFSLTIHEMDVRPGGAWRFIMHGPDGIDYPNENVYAELDPPRRLVYDHVSAPRHRMTATFDDEGGKTRLTAHLVFESAEQLKLVNEKYRAGEGLNQTLNRLGEQLAQRSGNAASDGELLITRTFNAPRDLVFKAWTEADRLAQWWGPKGFTMACHQLDLRPGGLFHYCMRSPAGQEMWGKFIYRDITPPEHLVFVNSFSDASGGTTRNPFQPVWPLEILNTLTLIERDGKTELTLRGMPIDATDEERAAFASNTQNMQKGFAGVFEQLDEYLERL